MSQRKYRIYDSQNEVMVYNIGIDPNGIAYSIPDDATEDCTSFDYYPDDEPMEWTGLTDKNNQPVYQGDIIKITADKEGYGDTSYGGFAEVVSQTCGYHLRVFNPTLAELDEQWRQGGDGWDSSSLWHVSNDGGKWIEVIGDVYRNPELLGVA